MNFRHGFLVAPQVRRVEVAVPQPVEVRIGMVGMPAPVFPMPLPLPTEVIGLPIPMPIPQRIAVPQPMRTPQTFIRRNECSCTRTSAPLCMEVRGEGPAQVVKSNRQLTPWEMQSHMEKFNRIKNERPCGHICERNPWDFEDVIDFWDDEDWD
jgi:hypothetical protein